MWDENVLDHTRQFPEVLQENGVNFFHRAQVMVEHKQPYVHGRVTQKKQPQQYQKGNIIKTVVYFRLKKFQQEVFHLKLRKIINAI